MKAGRISFLVFLMMFLCVVNTRPIKAAEGSWATMADMPTRRLSSGVAVVNGKIYVIGGSNADGYLNINEEYDPATNTWATKKPMPTPRRSFGIAACQNKIYVIGGQIGFADPPGRGIRCSTNEVYDPLTDTWETKTSMPTNRSQLNANVANGKIYLIGGLLPTDDDTGSNEVYDPATDSWSTKAALPTTVFAYASAVVDNRIFVIGGSRTRGADSNVNQIYDPETDTWSYGTPPPYQVVNAAAGATTGVLAPKRIYVIGGRIGSGLSGCDINQVHNPQNDNWTIGASMSTPRFALAIAVVNDILYAIGGIPMFNLPAEILATNEQYTPVGYIPEFPSWIMLPLITSISTIILVLRKRMGTSKCLRKEHST